MRQQFKKATTQKDYNSKGSPPGSGSLTPPVAFFRAVFAGAFAAFAVFELFFAGLVRRGEDLLVFKVRFTIPDLLN